MGPARKGVLAASLALLGSGGCGRDTTGPAPSLSLAVVPSPVTFSVLPPKSPPEIPVSLCCSTLVARWTLVVTATAAGDLVSAAITMRNRVTGYVYVDRQFGASQLATQVSTRVEAGRNLAIEQALLETMPAEFTPDEPLLLRLEVTFTARGQTLTAAADPPFRLAP